MPQVSIRSPEGNDWRIPLDGRVTIGRDDNSRIRLVDRSLSRRHAEIQQRGSGCYLIDLGSTNGTYLNGSRVEREHPLRDGDVIVVGEVTMIFHEHGPLTEVQNGNAVRAESEEEISEPTRVTAAEPRLAATNGQAVPTSARSFPMTDLFNRATGRYAPRALAMPEARVLGILAEASGALLSQHPLPVLFERILDLLLSAIPAERAAIMLLEGESATPVIKARRSRANAGALEHVSHAITRRVIDNHVALLLPDVLEDDSLRGRASIMSGSIRCAMCVPLWVAASDGAPTRVLGLVYLDSRARQPGFTETDLEILTVLANVAAAKIETTRLIEENLEKRVLEEDLRLAADIQMRVLPGVAPEVPGLDIAASTRPCRTVGGDYYDLMLVGDTLHLALGDVSGKGLGAAMLMIALRAAVRAHWADGPLAEATSRINATFHQNVPDDKYATFFVGRLDVPTSRLTYVNAGHNRPLLVRANGKCETLGHGGTVLGAFETAAYEEAQITLEPGDTLLVFSDGVSDMWADADCADSALTKLLHQGQACDAATTQREIFAEVERLGPPKPADDRTVLILKKR